MSETETKKEVVEVEREVLEVWKAGIFFVFETFARETEVQDKPPSMADMLLRAQNINNALSNLTKLQSHISEILAVKPEDNKDVV